MTIYALSVLVIRTLSVRVFSLAHVLSLSLYTYVAVALAVNSYLFGCICLCLFLCHVFICLSCTLFALCFLYR